MIIAADTVEPMRTREDASSDPIPLHLLTPRQRATLLVLDQYVRATGEPCPGRYLSRRLHLHHSTVQRLVATLHRKGWLRGPTAPSLPTRAL